MPRTDPLLGADGFEPLDSLRLHPKADLVPEMSADEYAGLLADITARGEIISPLDVTPAGLVLDGRQRLRAARDLALARVPVRRIDPPEQVEYMLAAALHRRHLNASQRAALFVELDEYRDARAAGKARQRANLRPAERATLPARRERPRERVARLAGVSPRTVQDVTTLRDADRQLFEHVKAGRLTANRALKQLHRDEKLSALPAPPPLPDGPFNLVYADPPYRSRVPGSDWATENHYPTLTIEEIKAIQPPVADDAILFLWVVNGFLREGLAVMEAWGFEYRTNLVWVKNWIGLGFWARNRHELLLIGRRGNYPLPDEQDRPDSVLESPRRRHSEKPIEFYELIERMYPNAARLELFARLSRAGWISWGNEVAA